MDNHLLTFELVALNVFRQLQSNTHTNADTMAQAIHLNQGFTSHLTQDTLFHSRDVRSFVLCGQGSSLLWTPALRPYSGPVRLLRERKGVGRCVRCMCECRMKEGLSRSEQLVGYFHSAPLLDVAYCLA